MYHCVVPVVILHQYTQITQHGFASTASVLTRLLGHGCVYYISIHRSSRTWLCVLHQYSNVTQHVVVSTASVLTDHLGHVCTASVLTDHLGHGCEYCISIHRSSIIWLSVQLCMDQIA